MQVYRFDRYWLLIASLVLFGYGPVDSILELTTTGTIDLNRRSTGRMDFPYWLFMIISWPIFLVYCVAFLLPAIKAIANRREFAVEGATIWVENQAINREEINFVRYRFPKGHELNTDRGKFYFHPGLSAEGQEAFEAFLNR